MNDFYSLENALLNELSKVEVRENKNLKPEDDGELPVMVETPFFTFSDLVPVFISAARGGRDPLKVRFTFTQRNDLSGQPWMVLGTMKGMKDE